MTEYERFQSIMREIELKKQMEEMSRNGNSYNFPSEFKTLFGL
jgi:hypothetical protein